MATQTAAPSYGASRHASPWLLVGLVALCLAVGWAGSFFTLEAIPTWYQALEKPAWTPPNWLFAPVWTTLYVLMAIAGWRVSRLSQGRAWSIWWIQLALNAIWTPLFFGAHAVAIAAVVIILLWANILWFIRETRTMDRTSSLLFVPYLVWVSYASSLNLGILFLN